MGRTRGTSDKEGADRSGKTAEGLVGDVEERHMTVGGSRGGFIPSCVEVMADKAGIKMPKEQEKKDEETLEAVKHSRQTRSREYSKQAALQELKEKHDVGKARGKGDPFMLQDKADEEAEAEGKKTKKRRGRGAAPPEEERKKPPTRRKTRSGADSAMSHVSCEENRGLADALYELAEFAMHGDALQKGLTYQKAAKSVREASEPIKSKQDAMKLAGIGRSVGEKVGEFLESGKMAVLEEYRSGKRGM